MNENTTATVTTKRCECGLWEDENGKSLTGCTQQVSNSKKLFLPGHDAKLKGAMIRAKHASLHVADGRGASGPAPEMASRFGFAAMVANATPRKKAAKAAEVAEVAPAPEPIAEVVAKAEAEEVAKDEAEAVAKVRAVRPRRTRKVAVKA